MKNTIIIWITALLILPTISFKSNAQQSIHYTSTTVINPIVSVSGQATQYTYQVFKNLDNSYGYSILANNVVYFKQTTFPGLQIGFSTEKNALIVAATIVAKIKSKRIAPLLSDQELIAKQLK